MASRGTGGWSIVKNLPANARDAGDMGWEDFLEEERAAHSSILTWEIPRTKEPGGLESMMWERADVTQRLSMRTKDLNVTRFTDCRCLKFQ